MKEGKILAIEKERKKKNRSGKVKKEKGRENGHKYGKESKERRI
jgi:hypothetical protein